MSVAVVLTPLPVTAQELRSRSILVLDQSQSTGPFFLQIFSGLRAGIDADASAHTTLFSESLDLSRFDGDAYDESLRRHFSEKYRDKDIGVIVAMGCRPWSLCSAGGMNYGREFLSCLGWSMRSTTPG